MVSLCGVPVAPQPPTFCMTLLVLCTWLLMAASLSAVPHGHIVDLRHDLSCAEEFTIHDGFCYRYFDSKRPFHHAEKLCSHHHSLLVSIHSLQEDQFIMQLLTNNSTAFWIGLNDEDGPATFHKEGVFKWTDGNSFSDLVSYHRWKPGEPINRNHLDCVKVDKVGWAMASGGCAGSRLPFVCKRQACPQGLEWGGTGCNIISDASKISQSHWPVTSHALLYSLLIVWLAVSAVVVCCQHRTSRTTSQEALKHHQRLPAGIQELFKI